MARERHQKTGVLSRFLVRLLWRKGTRGEVGDMINIFSSDVIKRIKGKMFMTCDPSNCNQYSETPNHTPPCFEYAALTKVPSQE